MKRISRLFVLAVCLSVFASAGCHGRRMICRDSDSSSYDACR